VLLLAPRQQVFRQLTTDTLVAPRLDGANENSLNNNNNSSNKNYTIRMSAEHSKVGCPVLLRVPDILTARLEFYLFRILPADHVGHLFLQRGNKPRKDFSSATRAVTKHLIGRAINAHQFRHCIATLFYGRRDSSDVLMRQLADTMNHDSQTQMQFYVHQQRLESQERMQSMLMEQVGMANNN
jgi:integrase